MDNKKIAIFPGSFNPFHKGHMDILLKTEAIFDKVIVAIGFNPEKEAESRINRLETLKKQLPGKHIEQYAGFLVDYVYEKEGEGYNVTIVRGVRNNADVNYEISQLRILEDQKPNTKMCVLDAHILAE